MTILITGSSGKTAANLAKMLASEHSILVASRSPRNDSQVRFDWLDKSTWTLPFEHKVAQEDPITAVYMVIPDLPAARQQVLRFVEVAHNKGVKRFVLLSAWESPAWGGALLGPVHGELVEFAQQHGVEWTVLRPHFFMENFAESYHLDSIKREGKIYTAAKDGKKPFISAKDIAAVAYHGLVDSKSHNTDYVMTGPESLTYSQVADIFTRVLSKPVEHVSLSEDEFRTKLLAEDFTEDMAEYMAKLDVRVAEGLGWETTDAVKKITGKEPRTFRAFVEENKQIWL